MNEPIEVSVNPVNKIITFKLNLENFHTAIISQDVNCGEYAQTTQITCEGHILYIQLIPDGA